MVSVGVLHSSERQKFAALSALYRAERKVPRRKGAVREEWWVGRENSTLVGMFLLVCHPSGLVEVRDFFVHPAHRGRGYGEVMVSSLVEQCVRRGARKVCASVPSSLVALFGGFGFAVEGVLKDHDSAGEDVVMVGVFLKERGERQVSLQRKLEDIERVQEIERETAVRLKKLRSN